MAEYLFDIVPPAELTGFVRELAQGDLPFIGMLPAEQVDDIEYELTYAEHGGGQVARFRTWDTANRLGRRPALKGRKGELAPLGLSFRLNERDLKRANKLLNGQNIGGERDRLIRQIFDDARNAANAINNRITWAHGELLMTGTVTLGELGDVAAGQELKAEFDVPAAHLNVTPATDWDDTANATPLLDLKGWEATYRANNGGRNPDAWLISPEVEALLAQNAQVKAQLNDAPTNYLVTPDAMRQVATAFGIKGRLVTMEVERPLMDDDEASGRVIGEQYVIGVSPSALGNTLYTPSPNAETLVRAGAGQELTSDLGAVAFQTASVDPAWIKTTADAVILPVLRDPSALFSAEVYTP